MRHCPRWTSKFPKCGWRLALLDLWMLGVSVLVIVVALSGGAW